MWNLYGGLCNWHIYTWTYLIYWCSINNDFPLRYSCRIDLISFFFLYWYTREWDSCNRGSSFRWLLSLSLCLSLSLSLSPSLYILPITLAVNRTGLSFASAIATGCFVCVAQVIFLYLASAPFTEITA